MEEVKFAISVKRGYKIFFLVCFVVFLIVAAVICIFGLSLCESLENYVATILFSFCFLFFAVFSYYPVSKKATVYKGRVEYSTMFGKKEYKPSEIFRSRTESVETDFHSDSGICYTSSDRITTFYDRNGKKLFSFGLAFENVDELQKYVDNNRKSIKNSKR